MKYPCMLQNLYKLYGFSRFPLHSCPISQVLHLRRLTSNSKSHLIYSLFKMVVTLLTFTCIMSFSLLGANADVQGVRSKRNPTLKELELSAPTLTKVEGYCSEIGDVPPEDITWNPVLILDNLALTSLCDDVYGTFPNPCNCSQFIMCGNGTSFLGTCAATPNTYYLPFDSLCSYAENSDCPTWNDALSGGDGEVTCQRLGQREWDRPLSLPANPELNCGSDYVNCDHFTQYEAKTCAPGKSYSKAYFGCIDDWLCELADKWFSLWL